MVSVVNTSKNTIIARQGAIADTALSRMTGLLNRADLKDGEALIITRCNSIHMFFMRFAIDAIFVGKDDGVVGLVRGIKPFRISPIFFGSRYVIEAPQGTIVQSDTAVGDKIAIEKRGLAPF